MLEMEVAHSACTPSCDSDANERSGEMGQSPHGHGCIDYYVRAGSRRETEGGKP
jgi:hypothetical protein